MKIITFHIIHANLGKIVFEIVSVRSQSTYTFVFFLFVSYVTSDVVYISYTCLLFMHISIINFFERACFIMFNLVKLRALFKKGPVSAALWSLINLTTIINTHALFSRLHAYV